MLWCLKTLFVMVLLAWFGFVFPFPFLMPSFNFLTMTEQNCLSETRPEIVIPLQDIEIKFHSYRKFTYFYLEKGKDTCLEQLTIPKGVVRLSI